MLPAFEAPERVDPALDIALRWEPGTDTASVNMPAV